MNAQRDTLEANNHDGRFNAEIEAIDRWEGQDPTQGVTLTELDDGSHIITDNSTGRIVASHFTPED